MKTTTTLSLALFLLFVIFCIHSAVAYDPFGGAGSAVDPCLGFDESFNKCGICAIGSEKDFMCENNCLACETNGVAHSCRPDEIEYREAGQSNRILVCEKKKKDASGNVEYIPRWVLPGDLPSYFPPIRSRDFENAIAGNPSWDGQHQTDCTCNLGTLSSGGGGQGDTSEVDIVGSANCVEGPFPRDQIVGYNRSPWAHLVHVSYINKKREIVCIDGSAQTNNYIARYIGPGNGGTIPKKGWVTTGAPYWEPVPFSDLLPGTRPPSCFAPGPSGVLFAFSLYVPANEIWVWVVDGFKYCLSKDGCGGYANAIPTCPASESTRGTIIDIDLGYNNKPPGASGSMKWLEMSVSVHRSVASSFNPRLTSLALPKLGCVSSCSGCANHRVVYSGLSQFTGSIDSNFPNTCKNDWADQLVDGSVSRFTTTDNNRDNHQVSVFVPCPNCPRIDSSMGVGVKSAPMGLHMGDECMTWNGIGLVCDSCDNFCSVQGEWIDPVTCKCAPCPSSYACPGGEWNAQECVCEDCTAPNCPITCNSNSCQLPASSPCATECESCPVINCREGEFKSFHPTLPVACRSCEPCSEGQANACPGSIDQPPTHTWSQQDNVCSCEPCVDNGCGDTNQRYWDEDTPCECTDCALRWGTPDGGGRDPNGDCAPDFIPGPGKCSPCIGCADCPAGFNRKLVPVSSP
eukprot:CAMPEP_0201544286 /NCGR_PEP_ID=MMETSP0173_2-20130828/872_1 /ASSEMBLY_ACC=CAM_ASM_000268 /TAXON_ID=218659 /ORGANISM="Vexillifera sp., Strain DIVA3 564/2" /LENGTH=685 /DNA_ID=CAMNT_0047952347 /DNA_START=269 /DNA_END=2326 /DNA_ORIENTATION=+